MATGLKNKQSFLIQKNWWLLKIFASKSPIWTLIFLAPLGVLFFLQISESISLTQFITCTLVGIIWWTFLEYMIHRFFFHWMSTVKKLVYYIGSFHLYHHQEPKDRRVYTSGIAPAILWSVVSMILFPLFFTYDESLLISSFTLLSYFIYEFAHYYAHVYEAKSGYLRLIQQNHFHHHLNPKVNFGQTSPLWDFVFGTYEKANIKINDSRKEFLYIEGKWNT
jgi:4-hydroxysphinganine ceramide fatty acyl 2-hydroxylase